MNDVDRTTEPQPIDSIAEWQKRWQSGTEERNLVPFTNHEPHLATREDARAVDRIVFHTKLDLQASVAATAALSSLRDGPTHYSFGRVWAKQVMPVGAILALGYYSRTSHIHSNPTHLHLGFMPVLQGTLISVVPHWSGSWVDILTLASIVLGLFLGILIGGAQAATVYGEGWFLLAMVLAIALPAIVAKYGRDWLRSSNPTSVNMAPITEIMESLFDAVEVK